MKKEFVPYEQSLALKELGFDEPCLTYYFSDGCFNDAAEEDDTLYPGDPRFYSDTNSSLAECRENELKYKAISAPTFSQAFRFFREKYELVVDWNHRHHDNFGSYIGVCIKNIHLEETIVGAYKTHEEAELACLIKLIEIVKNK